MDSLQCLTLVTGSDPSKGFQLPHCLENYCDMGQLCILVPFSSLYVEVREYLMIHKLVIERLNIGRRAFARNIEKLVFYILDSV